MSVKLTTKKIILFFLIFTIFIFCTGLTAKPANAAFFPSHLKYYTVKTKHFYIHFPEGLGSVAEEMQIITEEAYQNITSRLDWRPWGRTHVVLTDKSDMANGMATVLPYNYILLYAAYPDADSSLDHYKDYYRLLFNHELTHIVHIDMHNRWATPARFLFGQVVAPNGATPSWMREGMAVYEESHLDPNFGRDNSDHTMMVMRSAYYHNKFPRIDQIAGLTKQFPGGTGPYQFGSMFFDWLAKTYGEDRMYKYQKEYASSLWLFSLNNKARRVYGKSFYKLYKEFKAYYTNFFENERNSITAMGLTPLQDVIKNKDSQSYYTPTPYPDGYAYYKTSFDSPAAIEFNLKVKKTISQKELNKIVNKTKLQKTLFGQMTFSKTGRYIAFSSLASVEPQTILSEVYYYDLDKHKLKRVADDKHKKKAMRVKDPAFSPADNGQRWLVMTKNFMGTDQLYVFDLYEKRGYVITNEPKKTQLSSPRYSPDGSMIVASRKDSITGYRDIVIYSKTGKKLHQVTSDIKPDNHPVFSNDGQYVYFDSYRTGISNIFRYHLKSKKIEQITNVLDGVFQPMPEPGTDQLFVQHYQAGKTFIQKISAHPFNKGLYYSIKENNKPGINKTAIISGRHFSVAQNTALKPVVFEHTSKTPYTKTKQQTQNDSLNCVASTEASVKTLPDQLRGFTTNAADIEQIPSFLLTNYANQKNTDTNKKSKNKKQKAKKTYPSPYKNELSYYPKDLTLDTANPPGTKKYHVLPQLLVPRYLLPGLVYYENTFLVSAAIGRTDPLYRHSWTAFANYRSDAAFVGGGGTYIYSRYKPIFYIGGIRYAVDWGTVNGINFYEERDQGYTGFSWAYKKHGVNLAYFYEHRSALTNLNVNLINMKPYAGFRLQYTLGSYHQYTNSISRENGYLLKLTTEWANQYFGSDDVNEEVVLKGDLRTYLEMPWSDHHVLAFRAAAGWVWGDAQQFGVYRLGGPFGEGTGAGYSSRLFPLRGLAGVTYGGDYAVLFSSEYRIPLAQDVNWGIGTWPIFLDKIHMALFVDSGDIKYQSENNALFSRMLTSTGIEFSGNFVLGYGLPMTIRTGYGVIFTNRWRLGTLTDSVTMMSLKYGSVYFQFGTMF